MKKTHRTETRWITDQVWGHYIKLKLKTKETGERYTNVKKQFQYVAFTKKSDINAKEINLGCNVGS